MVRAEPRGGCPKDAIQTEEGAWVSMSRTHSLPCTPELPCVSCLVHLDALKVVVLQGHGSHGFGTLALRPCAVISTPILVWHRK